MHPALMLLIALVVPSVIVGAVIAIDAIRNAPEGREDESGFWYAEGSQVAQMRRAKEVDATPAAQAGRLPDYADTV